jgi:hypothetical protein
MHIAPASWDFSNTVQPSQATNLKVSFCTVSTSKKMFSLKGGLAMMNISDLLIPIVSAINAKSLGCISSPSTHQPPWRGWRRTWWRR